MQPRVTVARLDEPEEYELRGYYDDLMATNDKYESAVLLREYD